MDGSLTFVVADHDDDVAAPILVVDDREDSLLAVCAVLEPLGQPVVAAVGRRGLAAPAA